MLYKQTYTHVNGEMNFCWTMKKVKLGTASWCDKVATNVCHRKRYGSKCQHIFNKITIITYKILSLRCSITNVIYLRVCASRAAASLNSNVLHFSNCYTFPSDHEAVWFLLNQYIHILWFTINFIAHSLDGRRLCK